MFISVPVLSECSERNDQECLSVCHWWISCDCTVHRCPCHDIFHFTRINTVCPCSPRYWVSRYIPSLLVTTVFVLMVQGY